MDGNLKTFVRSGISILIAAAAIVIPVTQAAGTEHPGIAQVRRATAQFHALTAAEGAGYEAFLDCIDHPSEGGMGQHYVDFSILDGEVDALAPEALVYEVRGTQQKLVGVEYVVPQSAWTQADPPRLFGETFHRNDVLGIWALHAWIWRPNPAGMFTDFNRAVGACP